MVRNILQLSWQLSESLTWVCPNYFRDSTKALKLSFLSDTWSAGHEEVSSIEVIVNSNAGYFIRFRLFSIPFLVNFFTLSQL